MQIRIFARHSLDRLRCRLPTPELLRAITPSRVSSRLEPKLPVPATYTDEPVPKKDVAPGQNFSRFNLLTKITVFPFLGYPTADNSKDSWVGAEGAADAYFIQRFTVEVESVTPREGKMSGDEQQGTQGAPGPITIRC